MEGTHGHSSDGEVSSSPGTSSRRDACTATRLLALLMSFVWGVPGFALIDLDTALPPGEPRFREHWFLESGWGVFITALVVIPLVAVAVAPGLSRDVALQLQIMAGCAVAAGAMCLELSMAALALAFSITSVVVWSPLREEEVGAWVDGGRAARHRWALAVTAVYAGVPLLFGLDAYTGKVAVVLIGVLVPSFWLAFASRVVVPGARGQARSWWLVLFALLWCGPWVVHALATAQESWEGLRYIGAVERVSAHVAFAITMGVLPIATAIGWHAIRVPLTTVSVAGGGFGAFSVLYPTHMLSPGSAWGVAAMVGSLAMLAAMEATLRRRGGREYAVWTPLLDPPR